MFACQSVSDMGLWPVGVQGVSPWRCRADLPGQTGETPTAGTVHVTPENSGAPFQAALHWHGMSRPVTYFNRLTQAIETEPIYGENFLRWAYENPVGRLALELLVKRAIFSRWYGWRMSRPESRQ